MEDLPNNNLVIFLDDNGEIVDSIIDKKKSPYESPMKTMKRYSITLSLPSIIEYDEIEMKQSKSYCFPFWWWKKV